MQSTKICRDRQNTLPTVLLTLILPSPRGACRLPALKDYTRHKMLCFEAIYLYVDSIFNPLNNRKEAQSFANVLLLLTANISASRSVLYCMLLVVST